MAEVCLYWEKVGMPINFFCNSVIDRWRRRKLRRVELHYNDFKMNDVAVAEFVVIVFLILLFYRHYYSKM